MDHNCSVLHPDPAYATIGMPPLPSYLSNDHLQRENEAFTSSNRRRAEEPTSYTSIAQILFQACLHRCNFLFQGVRRWEIIWKLISIQMQLLDNLILDHSRIHCNVFPNQALDTVRVNKMYFFLFRISS